MEGFLTHHSLTLNIHKIVYIFLYKYAIIPENGFLSPSEQQKEFMNGTFR